MSATVHEINERARCGCGFAQFSRLHHDALIGLETDPDAVLDLFEVAVTWGELEYDAHIPPHSWLQFVDDHCWADRARVKRMVALALDVARRACDAELLEPVALRRPVAGHSLGLVPV